MNGLTKPACVTANAAATAATDIAIGETTGRVDEEAIEGIAGAQAHGAEIVAAVIVRSGEDGRAGHGGERDAVVLVADIGPVEIGLDADHQALAGRELVVVADLGAADEAAIVAAATKPMNAEIVVVLVVGPHATGVQTDVEARPGEGRGNIDRSDRRPCGSADRRRRRRRCPSLAPSRPKGTFFIYISSSSEPPPIALNARPADWFGPTADIPAAPNCCLPNSANH